MQVSDIESQRVIQSAKAFNRVILFTLVMALVIPGAVLIFDVFSVSSGLMSGLGQWIALLLFTALWLIGNVLTLVFYAAKRLKRPTRLFFFQGMISVCILFMVLLFWLNGQRDAHAQNLRWAVKQAIWSLDVKQVTQAINACNDYCRGEHEYQEWLALSVAVKSPPIFQLLSQDARFHQSQPWVGLNAPKLQLSYSCKGYYVGDANLFELAVLQDDTTMIKLITAYASQDEKNAALWYAVRANQIDIAEWLLEQGADPMIKDALGIEHNGRSLLDAAIEGYAVEALEWLLAKGYPANGPIGQDETNTLKHTPLHSLIYAAENELHINSTIAQSLRMQKALLLSGADINIAKPHHYSPPYTALQELLESNVYEQSAYVVQQMVKHGLAPHDLTPLQQQKLTEFMIANTDSITSSDRSNDKNCAEALIKNGMRYE